MNLNRNVEPEQTMPLGRGPGHAKSTESSDCAEPEVRALRPWGWYETIAQMPGSKIKRIHVQPGFQLSLQRHRQRAEHWVVTQGVATVTLGTTVFDLQPTQHCDIALGQVHRLSNRGLEPVEIVEVQFGAYLGEDDIERLEDDYGRE